MSEQITTILKRKLEDLTTYGGLDAETRRNALKGELQYYVLNFICHHRKDKRGPGLEMTHFFKSKRALMKNMSFQDLTP